MMNVKFGPSGNPDAFYEEGNKASVQMPGWVERNGLDAYEYQCSKGVNVSEKTAVLIGEKAKEHNVFLSIHAPYYISLSSVEEAKRLKSVDYIMKTLECAKWMGAKRIVVHSGSCSKMSREEALDLAKNTLKIAAYEAKNAGYDDIFICPETMGKINQLGNVDEVLELCKISETFMPCFDFGHINAREMGSLNTPDDFLNIVSKTKNALGEERSKRFHVHFTRIAFTDGGEKNHIPYDDESFGPCFDPFAEVIVSENLEPVVICESPGTQARDALIYKSILENIMKRK